MQSDQFITFIIILQFLSAHGGSEKVLLVGDHGDPKYDQLLTANTTKDDLISIRDLIKQSTQDSNPPREKSIQKLSEVNILKESLLKSPAANILSGNLSGMLKDMAEKTPDSAAASPMLGLDASEAIADPLINVIDSHVSQIIKMGSSGRPTFQPDLDEMKNIAKQKHKSSDMHNLYRENLQIDSIQEETKFFLGQGVDQWKSLRIDADKTALVGRALNRIIYTIGYNDSYELKSFLPFDEPVQFEVMKVWDNDQNRVRNLLVVATLDQLIWYELLDSDMVEFHRWNLLKQIASMIHFTHDASNILLVSTVDDSGKIQAEFIKFNVPDTEFWVIQAFSLPMRPSSMTCIDLGRDLVVAFALNNSVTVYRHQFTKHLRGKFSLFKTIEAANVTSVSGFRIGGHSYLAIGGDQPKILRYSEEDFVEQTILSQSFGFVEEYHPIPIRTYRDDLLLLVQHRLDLGTHTVAVIDALIWNGIAFETALSVPCKISADPNANGFTCMLDMERDEGLTGASFVHHEKENGLFIIVPRHEAHSGLFRIKYSLVDTEDPLLKEMEQLKKSIELINQMLEYEERVKKEVDEALKTALNPKSDFRLQDLRIDEVHTDLLEFLGNVELESNVIDFLDSSWSQEDFLVDLDELEKMITADEQKLKMIDGELNNLNRIHRQAPQRQLNLPDSNVHYLGPYDFNGQLSLKTIRVEPKNHTRSRRQTEPMEESKVMSLKAKNIDVQMINGIPVTDLIFLDAGLLEVANLTFIGSVQADYINMPNDGRVNGIDFSRDVLAVDSPSLPKNLIFENVIVQSADVQKLNNILVDLDSLRKIELPSEVLHNLTANSVVMRRNLNVETVNGIDWKEFVDKLVPKHLEATVDDISINGDVVIVGDVSQLNVMSLNGISFPDGFVLRTGDRTPEITGRKIFVGDLETGAIDTDGKIDALEPSDMITLDQAQSIPAETTFKVLEVIRKLEVNGTIAGQQLNDFLPNPTLNDTKEIAAACSFRELMVNGDVIIKNSFNEQNLETVLADVVYESRDGSEVVISAPKSFIDLEVNGDVQVSSNLINGQKLENFLLNDRNQVVSFNKLDGDVFFTKLSITGLFDGINATELDHNSIRTFGDQFVQTPITIGDELRAQASSVEIKETLNGVKCSDFMFIDQQTNVASSKVVTFNDLEVENLKVEGDVVGPGSFQSLDLMDMQKNHLSKSRDQNILVPVNIKSLISNGTFVSTNINGIDFNVFIKYMRGIRDFKTLILSGDQKLDNLIVHGNVTLKTINTNDFNQLVQNVIWLNRPNTIDANIKFLDNISVEGDVQVQGNVNKKPFRVFKENWISNQSTSVFIGSDKVFNKDVNVEESLKVETINGIAFEDLLTLEDTVVLTDLNVLGNINAINLTVDSIFNQQRVKSLVDLYSYDTETSTHCITSSVHFNQPTSVNYLNTPTLNQMNVSKWMENLIRVGDSNVYVSSEKVFSSEIIAQNGFYSEMINDIKMNFLNQIILISDSSSIINIGGDLFFTNDVYAQQIGVKGDLFTRFISNCDTMEWLSNALPIDRDVRVNAPLRIKSSALKASVLIADYLNGVPFTNLFTLNTNQTFDHEIKVAGVLDVKSPLVVTGYVNGLNIEHEHENTVMRSDKHQMVTVKTTFGPAHIYETLTTHGKVNSKYLQNIVLLNSSPTIESAVNLKTIQAASLHSSNLISGVNFDKWYDNVLWSRGKEEQMVLGNWKVKKLKLTNDAHGNGLINEVSVNEIEKNLKTNIKAIESAISNHASKYQQLCAELGSKANVSQHSIHILKYLELDFKIQEETDIFSIYAFKTSPNVDYLAVNTNCSTQLYKWDRSVERFKMHSQVTTGVVYDWATVKNTEGEVFIVTNSRMEANLPCQFGGLNVWKMNEEQMFHVNTIPIENDIQQLHVNQQHPGRFFTLNSLDAVEHFDVFGEKKEFWNLPLENYNYSFLPPEMTGELTLYNGHKLFKLKSKFKKRPTRFLDQHLKNSVGQRLPATNPPIMQMKQSQGSNEDSAMYSFKMPQPKSTNLKSLSQMAGDSPVYNFTMPGPDQIKKLSVPSIPMKPFVDTEHHNNFAKKMRQVGDALRNGLKNRFSKLPKLKIRNATASEEKVADVQEELPKDKQASEDIQETEIASQSLATNQPSDDTNSFLFIKPKNDDNPDAEGLLDKLKNVGKVMDQAIKTALTLETKPPKIETETEDVRETVGLFNTTESSRSTSIPDKFNEASQPVVGETESVADENEIVSEQTSDIGTSTISSQTVVEETKTIADENEIASQQTSDVGTSTIASPRTESSTQSLGENKESTEDNHDVEETKPIATTVLDEKTSTHSSPAVTAASSSMKTSTSSSAKTEKVEQRSSSSTTQSTPQIENLQIILPLGENQNSDDNDSLKETSNASDSVDDLGQQQVPIEVLTGSGIIETENPFLPERGTGESMMMYVGPRHQKRPLYAVTRNRDSFIKGNHSIIEIYNDIFEGSIYQYVPCSDPSNLVALQFNDETLFAFLESRSEILIYTYQGVQGFVGFRRIKLPGYALQMTSLTLPPKIDYKCDNHYLVVRMETEILFYGVKVAGNCGMDKVHCDDY